MSFDRQTSALSAPDAGQSIRWASLVIGLLMGVIAMDLVVRRPLMRDLAATRVNMSHMQRELEKLVGVRDQVWETNNLLTGLKAQNRQIEEARVSVIAVQQLCKELQAENEKMQSAFNSLDQLVALKASVIKSAEETDQAQRQAAHLVALQKTVVTAGEHAQHANAAINALVRVRDAARIEMADIEAAMSSVRKLGELKQQTIAEAQNTEEAREHLTELVAIKSDLVERGDSGQAASNLKSLIGLQDQLNLQTKDVASAVQNLEVLSDLGDELSQQVEVMNSMRKSLMDIVLMEATVNRVARIIEPLTQLGNLRRLNDEDLRSAAQSVIDARQSRVARKPADLPESLPLPEKTTNTLKLNDLKFFEEPQDILVPMPPADDIDSVLQNLSK